MGAAKGAAKGAGAGRRLVALAAVLSLTLAACGRGGDDTATETSGPATSAAPETTSGAEERVTLDDGGFGELGTVCSEGDAAPVEGVTGIDGTTVNAGVFSDVGFAGRPGLLAEFNDLAEAFTTWCNEHGGVRGYRLQWNERDAALTEHQARMIEACDQDFALVGGGATFDDAGQPVRLGCGLPDFAGFVVTNRALHADLVVPAVPNGGGTWASGDFRWLGETFPESTDAIGLFYADFATMAQVNDHNREIIDDLGWEVVYEGTYNVQGESTWKPFAQAMQQAGVEGVVYVGEPANLAALRKAMADIDYEPAWVRIDANGYDENYITTGGDAVAHTYVRSVFWPFEEAADNPATSDYVELMERYNPDGKIALLGAQGLSAWLLFATSLGQCVDAGDVSRDCVYSTALDAHEWTAGGLHAPTDPASREFPECYTIIEATGDGFVRAEIDVNFGEIYNCDPANVFRLRNSGIDEGERCPSGKEDPLPSECSAG